MSDNTSGEDNTYDPEDSCGNSGGGEISVHIDTASAWSGKTMAFYAKNSNGTWDVIGSWNWNAKDSDTRGNKDFTVSSKYVEFGFEVDVEDGTNYPYSKVFWTTKDTADNRQPTDIDIQLGGTTYSVNVTILVNGNIVDEVINYPSNTPYGWNGISFELDRGGAYSYKSANFYGRKSSSSPWVKLIQLNSGGPEFADLHPDVSQRSYLKVRSRSSTTVKLDYYTIPRDYVEFGFEFDVADGTNWPYSNVFWTAAKSAKTPVDKIKCETGGGIRLASIAIYVNDTAVVRYSNCDSHEQHDWSYGSIKLEIKDSGAYTTKHSNFKARKAGGDWETLFSRDSNNDIGINAVNPEYVDFGYEFDIKWSYDWPYSHAFWKAEEHPGCTVTSIFIEIGGYIGVFGDPHIDIVVQGYNASGTFGTLYTYSNHDLVEYSVTGW